MNISESLITEVVTAWDAFSEAMDGTDTEEQMTECQRVRYSRLSDAVARLRTVHPAATGDVLRDTLSAPFATEADCAETKEPPKCEECENCENRFCILSGNLISTERIDGNCGPEGKLFRAKVRT
jgi:hypothetical protein